MKRRDLLKLLPVAGVLSFVGGRRDDTDRQSATVLPSPNLSSANIACWTGSSAEINANFASLRTHFVGYGQAIIGGVNSGIVTGRLVSNDGFSWHFEADGGDAQTASSSYWDESNKRQRIRDRDELMHWRDKGYQVESGPCPPGIVHHGEWVNIPVELRHARRWAQAQGYVVDGAA